MKHADLIVRSGTLVTPGGLHVGDGGLEIALGGGELGQGDVDVGCAGASACGLVERGSPLQVGQCPFFVPSGQFGYAYE